MGWYGSSNWQSLRQVTQELLQEYDDSGTILGHASTCFGRRLWVAFQPRTAGAVVLLFLIDRRGGGWMYKPMDEGMHPYYYDCPVRILSLAGEPSTPKAAEWRECVYAYHARRVRKFAPGQKVTVSGRSYTIERYRGKSPIGRSSYDGECYRLNPARIDA